MLYGVLYRMLFRMLYRIISRMLYRMLHKMLYRMLYRMLLFFFGFACSVLISHTLSLSLITLVAIINMSMSCMWVWDHQNRSKNRSWMASIFRSAGWGRVFVFRRLGRTCLDIENVWSTDALQATLFVKIFSIDFLTRQMMPKGAQTGAKRR